MFIVRLNNSKVVYFGNRQGAVKWVLAHRASFRSYGYQVLGGVRHTTIVAPHGYRSNLSMVKAPRVYTFAYSS